MGGTAAGDISDSTSQQAGTRADPAQTDAALAITECWGAVSSPRVYAAGRTNAEHCRFSGRHEIQLHS